MEPTVREGEFEAVLADFGHCERLTAAKQRVSFDQLMNFSAHWRHRHSQKLIQPRGLRAPEVILG